MKGRAVVPLVDLDRRSRECGRIRMGEKAATKSGKTRPASIKTFRLTSPDLTLIEAAAALYGGVVQPWNERGQQWQLVTERNELPVVLVPGGLTTTYELWSGGGRKRACDGLLCSIRERCGPDDYCEVEVPCLCTEEGGQQACKPKTRLQVLLPELPFAGTWRLESSGWNAATELPGMYDTIVGLAEGQFISAVLGFNHRKTQIDVGDGVLNREYPVPYLRIEQTVHGLAAGRAGLLGISAAGSPVATPALPRGGDEGAVTAGEPEIEPGSEYTGPPDLDIDPYVGVVHPDDDEITDAEIVDDDETGTIDARLRSDAENFGLDPAKYLNAVKLEHRGNEEAMAQCSRDVRAGTLEPLSVAGGKVNWKRK